MSSIISNRKFLIKSPNEILHDKIEELIEENKKEALSNKINTINTINTITKKPQIGTLKNRKYFIPKYYI